MLTATPLLKVRVYVHKDHINRVLFNVGREGLIHLIDVKDDLAEELSKGFVRPLEVSTQLYRISTLISKIDKLTSTLKITPEELSEGYDELLSKFSVADAEALIDSAERLLASGGSSAVEKVKERYGDMLSRYSTILRVVEALESAKMKMVETATTIVFSGWIPKQSLDKFSKIIEKASSGNYTITYEEPKLHVEEREAEVVEEKLELVDVRVYVPKRYIDDLVYALTGVEHSVVDLRDLLYTEEFKEKVKPLEPSPLMFKLSSLSSRLDALFSSLGLKAPEEVKPLDKPIPQDKLEEIDSLVSSLESEVFSIQSRLENLRRSMEVASRVESEVTSIATSQVPATELVVYDVKGPLRAVMLQLTDEMSRLQASLDRIRSEYEEKLKEFKSIVEGARLVEEKKLKMLTTDGVVVLQLSVPKGECEKLLSVVKEATEGNFTHREVSPLKKVKVKKVVKAEAVKEVKVPTLMRNPRWSKVYENIVRGFGILNYREIDPTVIWFFTFPIFFGIMFGDMGHGIVLLILSSILYYFKRKGVKGGEISSYIIQGAPLLMACAIVAIFFGFVYGEFFGSPHTYGYLLPNIFENEAISGARAAVLSALGLSSTPHFHLMEPEGARALLKFAIYIAIFHITLGLVLSIINKIRLKEYKEAIIGPGLWLWLYVSGAVAFITMGRNVFNVIFGDPLLGFIYIWLPFIVMMIVRIIFMGGIDGFSESLDSLIASLSNTISYARLFAFAMIHVVLTSIFTMIDGGLLDMIGLPTFVGVIAGTLFFVFFEIVFVFLQALRLHWVEHGLKFLIANGEPFQPFIIKV